MIRISAPPGASTISLSTEVHHDGLLSPGKAVVSPGGAVEAPPPAEDPAPEEHAAEAVEAPAENAGPATETLKLQAISAIATAQDTAAVRGALAELLKRLQAASVSTPKATPAAAAAAAAADGVVPSSGDVALDAMRAALKLRGTHGIIAIGKKFRSMDDNNDKKITYDEFKKALTEMKLGLSEQDMTRLFRHFDVDANGSISFNELLVGLRGQLNERRKDMIGRAFKVLDKTGDGLVTLADVEGRYDASRHPDVVAGTKTQRAVLLEFMDTFESGGGGVAGDGMVTLQEFEAYYAMVSASIDGDDYFELVIRNVWHISGGEGWCANTTCKRLLVVHTDGTQTVEEVKDDFDVDLKDIEGVKKKLIEQGITSIQSISMYGDMAEATPAPSAAAAGPSTSTGATTPSVMARNRHAMRSSIVFG